MLSKIDPLKEIPKQKYESLMEPLMIQLQRLNRQIFEAKIPVLLMFDGWEGAGKGDSINRLLSRLDPRGTRVHPFHDPTEEERLRPFFWRYWIRLPSRGQVGVFETSWHGRLIQARVDGDLKLKRFHRALDAANSMERLLAEDGAVIQKFWMHLSKKEQRRRFKKWEEDPAFSFRVTKEAWKQNKDYGDWLKAAEEAIERTNTHLAPWTVVESDDRRWRRLKVVQQVCSALERALAARPAPKPAKPAPQPASVGAAAAPATLSNGHRVTTGPNPIDDLNLSVKLTEDQYKKQLGKEEDRMRTLQHLCFLKRLPVVVMFEGMDAAGKGGAIRRLATSLDPRGYTVIPVAAPEGEEKVHHSRWRFWRNVPKGGHWAIFDRSWYGRVLVERVEGFCRPDEWGRAYAEIRDFESQLTAAGAVVIKFWLQISLDEQLKRFKDREKTEHKRFKITAEDWRNREKYPAYRDAIADMLLQTSTGDAPWTLVEANDKLWARVKILRTINEAVELALKAAKEPAGGLRI